MNAKIVEEFIEKRLKRLLGKNIALSRGPLVISKISGIHPEVSVHVTRIEDFDGVMPDGAHTKRRPVRGDSTFRGYEEERPGRITLTISCIAGSYKLTQEMCDVLTPGVLLSLEMLPRFSLGYLPDDSVQLHFEDFISNFHSSSIDLVTHDDFAFYKGELTFYIKGFIHEWLTKRGGFSSRNYNKSRPRKSINPKVVKKKESKVEKSSGRKRKLF